MRYYIVDDDMGTVKNLENIIEMKKLGEIAGFQTEPDVAVQEILAIKPDIVIVDLLMSKMDGIALVGKIKELRPEISFVMISKVSDKEMIEQAYNAGVEFFINKPINIIEVEKVLQNVSEKIKMNSIMVNIKGMFSEDEPLNENISKDPIKEINMFLGFLGMLGEKGTTDIQNLCQYLIENHVQYSKETLADFAIQKGDTVKNIEQRIRRAIKKGMTNVANIAIDDYGNEVFQVYSNYVFDFKNIKEEMDCIKGKGNGGGRVNISKFIEGLITYRDSI